MNEVQMVLVVLAGLFLLMQFALIMLGAGYAKSGKSVRIGIGWATLAAILLIVADISMSEYLDTHSKEVVSRIDGLLASVDDAIVDWEITRQEYDLSDDLITEGKRIIEEMKAQKDGKNS